MFTGDERIEHFTDTPKPLIFTDFVDFHDKIYDKILFPIMSIDFLRDISIDFLYMFLNT